MKASMSGKRMRRAAIPCLGALLAAASAICPPAAVAKPAAPPKGTPIFRILTASLRRGPDDLWELTVRWQIRSGASWPAGEYYTPFYVSAIYIKGHEIDPARVDIHMQGTFRLRTIDELRFLGQPLVDPKKKEEKEEYVGALLVAFPAKYAGKTPKEVDLPKDGSFTLPLVSYPEGSVFKGKGRIAVGVGYIGKKDERLSLVSDTDPVVLTVEFTEDGKAPPDGKTPASGPATGKAPVGPASGPAARTPTTAAEGPATAPGGSTTGLDAPRPAEGQELPPETAAKVRSIVAAQVDKVIKAQRPTLTNIEPGQALRAEMDGQDYRAVVVRPFGAYLPAEGPPKLSRFHIRTTNRWVLADDSALPAGTTIAYEGGKCTAVRPGPATTPATGAGRP